MKKQPLGREWRKKPVGVEWKKYLQLQNEKTTYR